jgi:hypothetical protein
MVKTLIGLIISLLLNISLFGQESDFEKIFKNEHLKQFEESSLREINFIDKANGKTIVLCSLVKGCKWILEEMAYYNKLKNDYSGELEVFIISYDDILTMSEYIKDVNFDFIYIFDPEMIINQKLFQEDSIYSVLFDSNGNIQEKTKSGKLNRENILKQLNKLKAKSGIKQSSNLPLVNFQIKRYELGDEVSSNLSSISIPTKIMTGYKANEIIDTIESIKICTLSGKNILELYSYAYDLSKSRFKFEEELEYINSHSPKNRYTVSLSVSNLHANFNKFLIQQINLNFGLEITEEFEEKEVLILSGIDTDKGKIKIANNLNDAKTSNENISEEKFQLSSNNMTASEISKFIEEATMLPVEVRIDPNLRYSVAISIENNDKTIDNLIRLLSDDGLVIYKERKEVKSLKISNSGISIK